MNLFNRKTKIKNVIEHYTNRLLRLGILGERESKIKKILEVVYEEGRQKGLEQAIKSIENIDEDK